MSTITQVQDRWPRQLGLSMGTIGAGLLVWLAISSALLSTNTGPLRELASLQAIALALAAAVLALSGGAVWLRPHLNSPWQTRARLAWSLALAASLTLLVQKLWPSSEPGWATSSAAAACISALAWIACEAALERGTTGLWIPARLALALYGGLVVVFALVNGRWPGTMPATAALPSLLMLGTLATALLIPLWKNDGGLRVQQRWQVLVLLVPLPWLLVGASVLWPRLALATWPLAALATALGTYFERVRAPRRP